jgi:hypothetical protein
MGAHNRDNYEVLGVEFLVNLYKWINWLEKLHEYENIIRRVVQWNVYNFLFLHHLTLVVDR